MCGVAIAVKEALAAPADDLSLLSFSPSDRQTALADLLMDAHSASSSCPNDQDWTFLRERSNLRSNLTIKIGPFFGERSNLWFCHLYASVYNAFRRRRRRSVCLASRLSRIELHAQQEPRTKQAPYQRPVASWQGLSL